MTNFLHSFLQQIDFGVNAGLLQTWDFLGMKMSLLVKEYRYPRYTDEGYNIEMVLPDTPEIYVFVCGYVCMYLCIQ